MPLRNFDVVRAVSVLWGTSGLDAHFNQYWTSAQIADFLVLMDVEAAPTQPWPYCVYESIASTTLRKSSASTPQKNRQEQNEDTVRFHVFAKDIDAKSGKALCSDLADEILKVFGGHPDTVHQKIPLQNGSVINQKYSQTILTREDEDIWKAVIVYTVLYELSLID